MPSEQSDREALKEIARLYLEPGDYDYDPASKAPGIACDAIGWVYWQCSSRFTACGRQAVGPSPHLLAEGWALRDDRPRCPEHALTTDPTEWPAHLDPRNRR